MANLLLFFNSPPPPPPSLLKFTAGEPANFCYPFLNSSFFFFSTSTSTSTSTSFPRFSNGGGGGVVVSAISTLKKPRKKKQTTNDDFSSSLSNSLLAAERSLRFTFMEELMGRARSQDAARVSQVIYDMMAAGLKPGPRSFHGLIVSHALAGHDQGAVIELGGTPTIGDCGMILRAAIRAPLPSAFLKILQTTHSLGYIFGRREFPRLSVQCSSRNRAGGGPSPSSDENGSKSVLDAFFLGKALAEAINERIESSVGELLSTVGRLQAEQQKQVQEFQEEVKDRAKKAKEKAAQESLEAQRRFSRSTTSAAASSDTDVTMVEISSSVSSETVGTTNNSVNPSKGDILLGMMNDD